MGLQQAYRAADAGKRRGCNTDNNFHLTIVRRLLAAAVLVGALGLAAPSHAQSGGPFAGLSGNWNGGGTVILDDGSTERIRCRASYRVAGAHMDLTLTCASDAYRFGLQADVVSEGPNVSGSWSESSRNVSGSLQGRGGNGNFQVTASTAGFNADIALATHGNKQTVTMRADSQFKGANIALTK